MDTSSPLALLTMLLGRLVRSCLVDETPLNIMEAYLLPTPTHLTYLAEVNHFPVS